MKLKYKKIILLTTMSTMGIGILTLSVSQDRPKAEEMAATTMLSAEMLPEEEMANNQSLAIAEDALATPSAELSPTAIPSPTPIPVYPIEEKGTYPDIDALFDAYYTAKNNRDIDTGEDGKQKIFSGTMDAETKNYYDERNNDEDVIALIEMTDEKSSKAIEKDEDLKNFWESIDAMTKNDDGQKAEGDSAE